MIRRSVLAALILACVWLAAAPGEAQRERQRPGLPSQIGWVKFTISSGRIAAESEVFGRGMSSSTQGNDREETLSLEMNGPSPVVRYEARSPAEHISLVVVDRDDLRLAREPLAADAGPRVELRQPPGGPVTLTIGAAEEERTVQGATLWHVLLADPEGARAHLLPLLDLLAGNWRIDETLAALDAALLRAAGERRAADRQRWAGLVVQLGSPRYAERQAAHRALKSADAAVAPFLRSLLDRRTLDAEQRLRVRRIVAAVERNLDDASAERIAVWLAWDPGAWLLLLSRPEEETRRRAAEQIALLTGYTVAFDAAAAEDVRAAQIEAIRRAIDGDGS